MDEEITCPIGNRGLVNYRDDSDGWVTSIHLACLVAEMWFKHFELTGEMVIAQNGKSQCGGKLTDDKMRRYSIWYIFMVHLIKFCLVCKM